MSSKTVFQYFKDEEITIGINLGNALDAIKDWDVSVPTADETAWGSPKVTQEYFNGLKEYGFKVVRIPVTWMGHIGPAPDYIINQARLNRVAEIANMVNSAGLKAIINLHHDCNHDHSGWLSLRKAITSLPERNIITSKYEKVWAQIAGLFKDYGEWLMFEAFNAVSDGNWVYPSIDPAGEYEIIKNWSRVFSDTVRASGGFNEKRYLIFNGYGNKPAQLLIPEFELPEDTIGGGGRQIVSFCTYEPWLFAAGINHEWHTEGLMGSKAYFDDIFGKIKSKFIDNEIPVLIGECGPFRYAKNLKNQWYNDNNVEIARQSRLEYIDYVYKKARECNIVPLYWEIGFYDPEYASEGDPSLVSRVSGKPNSAESTDVIKRMMDAVK
jgi:endoglucanase